MVAHPVSTAEHAQVQNEGHHDPVLWDACFCSITPTGIRLPRHDEGPIRRIVPVRQISGPKGAKPPGDARADGHPPASALGEDIHAVI